MCDRPLPSYTWETSGAPGFDPGLLVRQPDPYSFLSPMERIFVIWPSNSRSKHPTKHESEIINSLSQVAPDADQWSLQGGTEPVRLLLEVSELFDRFPASEPKVLGQCVLRWPSGRPEWQLRRLWKASQPDRDAPDSVF